MLISRPIPTVRDLFVRHLRKLQIDAELRELESQPLTVLRYPLAAPAIQSVHSNRGPK